MPYKDPEARKEYFRRYYARNAERRKKIAESNTLRRKQIYEFVSQYKLALGCKNCGFKKCSKALEMHHRDTNKEFTVAEAKNVSMDRLVAELNKCDVLCANCHRMEHCTRECCEDGDSHQSVKLAAQP